MHNFMNLSQRNKAILGGAVLLVLIIGLYFYTRSAAPRAEAYESACTMIVETWHEEYPEDGALKPIYDGEIPEVDYENINYPQIERLKTGISNAVANGANFAGHYAIVEWGCGTNCQEHAVVDVASGKPVAFGIPSEAGLQFMPDQNVIITNPAINFPSADEIENMGFEEKLYWYNLPREYYVLEELEEGAYVRRICIENPFDGD